LPTADHHDVELLGDTPTGEGLEGRSLFDE
jgi:hypothetical protein